VRRQAPALGDPAPHRRRVHRVQHVRRLGVGDGTAVGAEVPGRVEPERGV